MNSTFGFLLRRSAFASVLVALLASSASAAPKPFEITFDDPQGAVGRAQAPACVAVSLPDHLRQAAAAGRLVLWETTPERKAENEIAAQFEADPGAPQGEGRLWWLMPPGPEGARSFQLRSTREAHGNVVAKIDAAGERIDVLEDDKPVLRYNHAEVPMPAEVAERFKRGEFPSPPYDPKGLARGDYISPLHGLDGEALTEDFPADHVHHRGVNWAWATVRYRGLTRDLFAIYGVWARPDGTAKVESGPVAARVEAHNVWKWEDAEPIVDEAVVLRVFRQAGSARAVDVEIRLTPRVEGVEFCGRIGAGYSGFNIRMAPAEGQDIVLHTDAPDALSRRSWADYSAEFAGKGKRSGVAILQNAENPLYPSEWIKYTDINFFQPAYPGQEPIAMPKGETIVLRYRLWIHRDTLDENALGDAWNAYNRK